LIGQTSQLLKLVQLAKRDFASVIVSVTRYVVVIGTLDE